MFKVLKHTNQDRNITHRGYTLSLIAQVSDFEKIDLNAVDGFVLDTDKEPEVEKIMLYIRVKENLKNSLKPIFLQAQHTQKKHIKLHLDGVIDIDHLSITMERVAVITTKINQLKITDATEYESMVTQKVLGMLYTRNSLLHPVTDRKSNIGYMFPLLSLFYGTNEQVKMLQLLEQITTKGMLSHKLKDHVHLCKGCHGNYFNFREVCASCNSINIVPQDMIHHFVCAHVAPASDFINDEGLSCPKCDKVLRHIGIDYDKPSTIYHCNTCSSEFQQPKMEAFCIDCETINMLDELLQQSISEYSITQKGEQFLCSIPTKTEQQIDTISITENNCNHSLFAIILKQEIARIKTHNCESVYAQIKITNKYIDQLNIIAKKAFHNELLQVINSYILPSDIIASESHKLFHVLLPNTSFKELERLENIQYNVQKLLNDNLGECPNQVTVQIHKLKGGDLINDLLGTF